MDQDSLPKNPITHFQTWLQEATAQSGMKNPNAMALASSTPNGIPSVRMVLLKAVNEKGFRFFTNYEGRKGQELNLNPHAALCFYWDKLGKQIRVEGTVEKLSKAESEKYFHSRARGSQLGAWASKQSEIIPSHKVLEDKIKDLEKKFPTEIPLPDFWGGYLLKPNKIEFWQEQPNRLHDRFLYTLEKNGDWSITRLSP